MTGEPIFKEIFGDHWPDLPAVFHKHYAPRARSTDQVRAKGTLNIRISPLISIMARLTGALIPYSGDAVPVTVTFRGSDDGCSLYFDRAFHYPEHGTHHFRSRMVHLGGNELIEFIKFGIGWKLTYDWNGEKVILTHQGYVWRLFGLHIPIPLGLIIGHLQAEETAISDTAFHMWTHAKHPLFGEMLYYSGEFEIEEVSWLTTS